MSALSEPYLLFYSHRQLLAESTAQALRTRHAGSILGMAWLLVGPLLLLTLYAVLYTVIFKVQPARLTSSEYVLYIFAGLIPFMAFSQALATGATALSANKSLLLNRMFPAELIPAREVLAAGSVLLVGAVVVLAVRLVTGGISVAWLLLPPLVVLFAMATMGTVWAFALANLIVKDVQQLITYIVMMLLIASPIAYTPDMVPGPLRLLLYANPFAYYVMSFQSILVLGELPPWGLLAGCVVFAFLVFHLSFRAFVTGKRVLADQI